MIKSENAAELCYKNFIVKMQGKQSRKIQFWYLLEILLPPFQVSYC